LTADEKLGDPNVDARLVNCLFFLSERQLLLAQHRSIAGSGLLNSTK
jgi:hypothetical protein